MVRANDNSIGRALVRQVAQLGARLAAPSTVRAGDPAIASARGLVDSVSTTASHPHKKILPHGDGT